jgi:hypothetical protein
LGGIVIANVLAMAVDYIVSAAGVQPGGVAPLVAGGELDDLGAPL